MNRRFYTVVKIKRLYKKYRDSRMGKLNTRLKNIVRHSLNWLGCSNFEFKRQV